MDPWAIAWPRQRKMAQTGRNFDSIQDRQAPPSGFRRSAQPSSSMKIQPTRSWSIRSFLSFPLHISHSKVLLNQTKKHKERKKNHNIIIDKFRQLDIGPGLPNPTCSNESVWGGKRLVRGTHAFPAYSRKGER